MILDFKGKKISGVLSILPENEYLFEDEAADPGDIKNRRLKRIIGFGARRRVKGTTTLSDMLLYGVNHLLEENRIKKEEIGAIVVSTLSPDYLLPQISNILQGEMRLGKDVYCVDIMQACAGYVVGLIQAFMLLEHLGDKKVLVCTGEIFNRKSDDNEPKFEHPSFGGDIANISIVENSGDGKQIFASIYNDGAQREALIIHDGGFKNPMTPEKIAAQTNNIPCMGVSMDGTGVFNFVQKEVPPAVFELLEKAGMTKDDIDYFLFHQPNKFMLQKLAEKMEIPYARLPMDITEKLGNSDSGTIPAVMTTDAAEDLLSKNNHCCLSGFGGGLTWASIVMDVGNLDFCENIISNL